jgi:hypothetical protein
MHATTWRKQSSCISSALTGQTGHHHRSDWCPTYEQGQHSDRSHRWPWPVRPVCNRAQKWLKPLENLLNASSKPFQAQTSPPCWQCTNQAKNAENST